MEVASAAESVALEEMVAEASVLAAVWVDVTTTTVVPCDDVNVVSWALEVVDGAVVVEEVVEVDGAVVDEVDVGSGAGVDVVGSGAGVLLVLLVEVLVVVGSVEVVVGAAVDEEVGSVEEVVGWVGGVSLLVSAAEGEVCATVSAAVSAALAAIDAAAAAAPLDGEAIFNNNFWPMLVVGHK